MEEHSRFKRELQGEVCRVIRSALEKRVHRPKDHQPFLLEKDIRLSWEEADPVLVKLFLGSINIPYGYPALARNRSIKFLSILIWIRIEDWSMFAAHFILDAYNLDTHNLPLSSIKSSPFLMLSDYENDFLAAQYMFLPVIITEKIDLGGVPSARPLPFLESHLLGQDAHLVVTKKLIAAKHLRYNSGEHLTSNPSVTFLRSDHGMS